MAKLKLKKLPKKPKASASVATMEAWLKKVAEIKQHNSGVKRHNDHAASLRKKIAAIGSTDVLPSQRSFSVNRKKKSGGPKKKASKKRR
jgi:hypothetical protein